MRTPQVSQSLQFLEKLTDRAAEVRKYARFTTILLVCFISLPVIHFVIKISMLHIFEPYDSETKAKPLQENVYNSSSELLGGIGENVTKSNPNSIKDRQDNSSIPPITSTDMPKNDQQKLIDDLLASGFSKESCISRYQYPSYHKNKKPYIPSPYLIAKLRSYEKLHAQCGPQSSSYRKTIKKLSRSHNMNDSKSTPCKYLVWTPANGLGNRMVSLASAFLFSLLQNRVLLVQFEADMDGLFCEPFPNSTWLLPKKFPHRSNWSQLPSFKAGETSGENEFSPPFLHLNLQHGHSDHNLQHFHCNGTISFLEEIPFLILQSDQYFVPSLFMVPSMREELNRMFPKKDAVFYHLGHYLFNPSNEAWGLITRFYQAYLAKADEKIGLQIRVFNHQKTPTDNIMSQILACTQNENILPSFGDTEKGQNYPLQNSTSKSKAVLVASLYPEYAEKLRYVYWTRPTVNGDVVGVYQASHEEYQKFGDNMHNMKAWAEIYLLSLCDVILTSPKSTFGYVAHSLGGLKPWIMARLGSEEHQNPPCKQGFSMEPCFHVPPRFDCKNQTKMIDIADLFPLIKVCEDVSWGVKLVGS